MIGIKNDQEIRIMKEGGEILGEILDVLLQKAKPGVHTRELDSLADKLIREKGGIPSFKTVKGYCFATCMCVNDEVVHGIPDDLLREGDILCIDVGFLYQGFHTDTAWTIQIKNKKSEGKKKENKRIDRFLKAGKEALDRAIKQARAGNRIGHISKAIQETVEGNGYSVVRALVGHGIGRNLHEEPQIPGFLDQDIFTTPELVEGMTLAIEVIYNEGSPEVVYKNNDGWTLITRDGSLSAVFEHTILVGKGRPLILTGKSI